SRSVPAATTCAAWRWHFWKGIVDEPCGLGAEADPVARGLEGTDRDRTRAARRRDALRADWRGGPPLGSLRQQPRRRRALPGGASDLRLLPGPFDLGHRPSDLSAQADHGPGWAVAHDSD